MVVEVESTEIFSVLGTQGEGGRKGRQAGRREGGRRESGGGWRLTALKYFLSHKRDLLTDISEIVSQ